VIWANVVKEAIRMTGSAEQGQAPQLVALSEGLAAAVERAGAFTVSVDARRRYPASGIVWADNVVLAADHTIERDEEITIYAPDGRAVPATLAGRDPGSDLAVLRADVGIAPAPRAGEARIGHLALALGRGRSGLGASLGIISALGGPWRGRGGGAIERFIRAEITMYPGFSGGPLVDTSGALFGINSSGLRPEGLTIPAAAADTIVQQLLAHGRLKRGYLGVTSQPVRLPAGVAATAGQESGLLVVGIQPDSPAEQGGLLVGDILIGLADRALRDTDDLRNLLGPEHVDTQVPLRIIRGGEARQLLVTVRESPGQGRGRRAEGHGRAEG
jgi:S1-C subfamily serine protease